MDTSPLSVRRVKSPLLRLRVARLAVIPIPIASVLTILSVSVELNTTFTVLV